MVDSVSISATLPPVTNRVGFETAIRSSSKRISFHNYSQFIENKLCPQKAKELGKYGPSLIPKVIGMRGYRTLKDATEEFLLQNCSVVDQTGKLEDLAGDVKKRLGQDVDVGGVTNLDELFHGYLGGVPGTVPLPLLKMLRETSFPGIELTEQNPKKRKALHICYGILMERLQLPYFIELIWSYWQEQNALVQALNAISLRFQNRRVGDANPLARLDVDPLRPLGNLLWGYIQDEPQRLSVARRAYEYDHQYGLRLQGKAVPTIESADSRTRFLGAFHGLLTECARYYRAAANRLVTPDTFPALNALRELNQLLIEGMHNQYGDLPWTARCEMLMQQWLLARPEMLEFLGGRKMNIDNERWITTLDSVKSAFRWSNTPTRYGNDLAVAGEQLLLSVRFGGWNAPGLDHQDAALWMDFWRPEIQEYIYAYRAVSGVDLGVEEGRMQDPRSLSAQPAELMRERALTRNGRP